MSLEGEVSKGFLKRSTHNISAGVGHLSAALVAVPLGFCQWIYVDQSRRIHFLRDSLRYFNAGSEREERAEDLRILEDYHQSMTLRCCIAGFYHNLKPRKSPYQQ